MERGRRKLKWKESRRLQAWGLKKRGWLQRSIAEALGVSQSAVSRWIRIGRERGSQELCGRQPPPGAPPKLWDAQKQMIPEFLSHGAESYGFRGDFGICSRVASVIEQEFGVRYHKGHVARILKDLGWTPQKPITRATQRDEGQIERWRSHVWPALKRKARAERRWLIFLDESGFYLLPAVVKSYSPEGRTPVLRVFQTRDHLSVMGVVTLQGRMHFLTRARTLTGLDTVAFLKHLLRFFSRLLVIWDGSMIHRRQEVLDYLQQVGDCIYVHRLPPYAVDLNPVDGIWQYLKYVEMRNLCGQDLHDLHSELSLAIDRLRAKLQVILSFFADARLGI